MGNDDVIKCQSWSGWWIGARLRVAVATRCQGNNATQPISTRGHNEAWQVHHRGSCGINLWQGHQMKSKFIFFSTTGEKQNKGQKYFFSTQKNKYTPSCQISSLLWWMRCDPRLPRCGIATGRSSSLYVKALRQPSVVTGIHCSVTPYYRPYTGRTKSSIFVTALCSSICVPVLCTLDSQQVLPLRC